MKQSLTSRRNFLAASGAAPLVLADAAFGQKPSGDKKEKEAPKTTKPRELPFKVSDMRGKGEINGGAVAGGASKKMFTILEIHGDDTAVRKNAEDALLDLYNSGRTRIGMVIADGNPKEWDIWAGGIIFSTLNNVDASSKTNYHTVDELAAAYDKVTAPAWKAAQEKLKSEKSPSPQP
jgi:hypothetical protein